MSARDFDKSLQEKAQHLRLEPSAEVWQGVEAALQRKRRRRVVAWIFSTAALVAGIGLFSGQFYQPQTGAGTTDLSKVKNAVGRIVDNGDHKTSQPLAKPAGELQKTAAAVKQPQVTAAEKAMPVDGQSGAAVQQRTKYKLVKSVTKQTRSNAAGEAEKISADDDFEPNELAASIVAGVKPSEKLIAVSAPEKKQPAQSVSKAVTVPKKVSTPDKWHLSVVFGAGASNLVESGLQQYNTIANEYLYAINVPAGIAASQQRPSDVKIGPSFFGGMQLSRVISKKIAVGAGIQYVYYSNRINVGRMADSVVSIYNDRQELVRSDGAFKAAGNSGNTFYNQFHLLQLPVELDVNIGRRKHWALQTGVSLGYLIGVNTLQYNNQAGVYYRNNPVLRKWQTEVFTGFQYKFLTAQKRTLAVGPFARYQATSLDHSSSNKHLFSFGLGAKWQIR
jgi:Outer membrane protein beta-barrel domain